MRRTMSANQAPRTSHKIMFLHIYPKISLTRCFVPNTLESVEGHLDYSFASAWHPEGKIFATGNQDKTCRVWDLKNLSDPVSVLKGNMGVVRSVRFSSDGQFLVFAELADFVHVYNLQIFGWGQNQSLYSVHVWNTTGSRL